MATGDERFLKSMELIPVFMAACELGDLDRVRELLGRESVSVNCSADDENTALHLGAANGYDAVVSLLLQKGASVNVNNAYGWTPLMQAARHGHTAIVALLLKHKACVNARNKLGATGLVCAVRSGSISTVKVLLDHGAHVKDSSEVELTPLMVAAQYGYDSIVRLLVKSGCDVNYSAQSSGLTALMVAGTNGHRSTAKILVEHRVNLRATNVAGKTALDMAIQKGRRQIRCYLDQAMTSDSASMRDIFGAVKSGNTTLVDRLLTDHPQQIGDVRKEDGVTPLMLAAKVGDLTMVKFLLDRGAEVDQKDPRSGWTALTQSLSQGHSEVAYHLINCGADVNLQTKNGCTAFDIACISDKHDRNLLGFLAHLTNFTSPCSYSFLTLNGKKNVGNCNKTLLDKLSWHFRGRKPKKNGLAHDGSQETSGSYPMLNRHMFLPSTPTIHVEHNSSPMTDESKSPLLIHGSASPCRLTIPSSTLKPHVSPMLPSVGLDTSNSGRSSMLLGKKLESPRILQKDHLPLRTDKEQLDPAKCSPVMNLWRRNPCFQECAAVVQGPQVKSDEEDLYGILKRWSLEKYYPMFEEQEVDREALALLTDSDFRELGISSTVSRERLSEVIQQLKSE